MPESQNKLSELQNLQLGLLMLTERMEASEPAQVAIGGVSHETRHIQRQWQYCSEISRILHEMGITIFLASNPSSEESLKSAEINLEDLFTYHQGVFLDLVHQLKDKLFRLLFLISNDHPVDPPKKLKETQLISKCGSVLDAINITKLVKRWFSNSDSGINIALKKRTFHHHFISPLAYDEDKSRVKLSRTMATPNLNQLLSDYGKDHFARQGNEALVHFRSGVIEKMQSTLNEASININAIAKLLVQYKKLPTTQKDIEEIAKEYQALTDKLSIKNKASLDNLPKTFHDDLLELVDDFKKGAQDLIEAMYFTGDLLRGEHSTGFFSERLFIITKGDFREKWNRSHFMAVMKAKGIEVEMIAVEDFTSPKFRRARFYCWSDGVQLIGKDLIGKERFPKPGLQLAWLLNEDLEYELTEVKRWAKQNPQADTTSIAIKSQILARRILDFIYSVVMSNSAGYTPSTTEKITRILDMYPQNKKMINNITIIIKHGAGDIQSLKNIIINFRPQFELNYQKMKQVLLEMSQKKEGGIQ